MRPRRPTAARGTTGRRPPTHPAPPPLLPRPAAAPAAAEHVMGMAVSFDLRGGVPGADAALADVIARLHEVDATFSTYRADSVISRIASGALPVGDAPDEVRAVLDACAQLRDRTRG